MLIWITGSSVTFTSSFTKTTGPSLKNKIFFKTWKENKSRFRIMITDNDSAALGYCCSSTTPGTDGAFCGLYIYLHP